MKSRKPRELVKILKKKGFNLVRQKGSHRLYRKGNLRVTLPYHNKDMRIGTLKSILKQAEIDESELK